MDYEALVSHRLMIRDLARADAFRRAIEAVVRPGDVVLDVGAGCGILSLLAAQAGAARVYAVERIPTAAAMAAHLAQANGFGEVVHVIGAEMRSLRLAEKVDVIISEWMGAIGVDENMLGAVLWARDHFLKDGGRIIPQRVTAMFAPVHVAQRSDPGFFASRPFGLDLSAMAEPSVHELLMVRRRVNAADLVAAAQKAWESDLSTDPPASVRTPYQAELAFGISEAGKASALCGWFSAELSPAVELSNAPHVPDTHWGQLLLPLPQELALAPGDTLSARLTARAIGPGPLHFAWSVRVNDGPWQGQDTAEGPHMQAAAGAAEQPDPKRSDLSRFLAELSVDASLLATFLADPDALMARHGLAEAHQVALKSRDPVQIQQALYEAGQAP